MYPSIYEGFGIPIIEALYSRLPVIATTGSCLEEAGGPNSIYIHPQDTKTLATTISKLLNDPETSRLMVEEGLKFVQQFNNEVIATQLMAYYEAIASKR